MLEIPYCNNNQNGCDLQTNSRTKSRSGEVENTAGQQDSEIKGRKVVVKEELAAHDKKGKVVQAPAYEEETAERVVFDNFG